VIRKGFHTTIDSYSTRTTAPRPPALPAICASSASPLAGLAFDFCVRYSAEDGGEIAEAA
jgi:hypothetical protein